MIKFLVEWIIGTVFCFLLLFLGGAVYRCLLITFCLAFPDPIAQTALGAGAVIFGLALAVKERVEGAD